MLALAVAMPTRIVTLNWMLCVASVTRAWNQQIWNQPTWHKWPDQRQK
jgi:hypothetical protein